MNNMNPRDATNAAVLDRNFFNPSYQFPELTGLKQISDIPMSDYTTLLSNSNLVQNIRNNNSKGFQGREFSNFRNWQNNFECTQVYTGTQTCTLQPIVASKQFGIFSH